MDFYLWIDIPCARSWPRWKFLPRTPAVQVYIDLMRAAMAAWNTASSDLKAAYRHQAQGSGLTARDLWVRGYIKGLDY